MLEFLKGQARRLKKELLVLYLVTRSQLVGWPVRLTALLVVAYALSPIDLIPDFLPVIGLLDDLLLLPAGIWLCLRMIPSTQLQHFRDQAQLLAEQVVIPKSWFAAAFIVLVWLLLALWVFKAVTAGTSS